MVGNQEKVKFGQGQISGYLSVTLGVLSLGGVLCFLFPGMLTSEEFRKAYSVDFARYTLLVCLVVAYFFVSHLGIQLIFLFVNAFSEGLFGWAVNATFQSWVRAMPIWLQFIAAIFVAVLFQYATHRLHHSVPFLWRFHSIHHSSQAMDWLAGS